MAALPLNMPYGVTPISHEVYRLHMDIFYICVAIGVVVFGFLIYSLFKYRKSKGAVAAEFHEHLGIEILWTVIPFIILIIMAIPATRVLINLHNTQKPDLDIKVVGYQWKWKYEYLDYGINFFSNLSTPLNQIYGTAEKNPWFLLEVDRPLVVPIQKKIRVLVTSNDVIHSWWVPDLGMKQDAIPGFVNENWFIIEKPGTYRGQCAELCGANHGFMPIVVQAVTSEEFNEWVKHNSTLAVSPQDETTLSKNELLSLGESAYQKNCAACHQMSGQGLPPTFPALKNNDVVTGPLSKNLYVVINGVTNTAMQPFGDQLDNKTIASILTYIRSAWGNDSLNEKQHYPTTIQPKEIEAARPRD